MQLIKSDIYVAMPPDVSLGRELVWLSKVCKMTIDNHTFATVYKHIIM